MPGQIFFGTRATDPAKDAKGLKKIANDICRLAIDVTVDRVHEDTDWLVRVLGVRGESEPSPHPHYC